MVLAAPAGLFSCSRRSALLVFRRLVPLRTIMQSASEHNMSNATTHGKLRANAFTLLLGTDPITGWLHRQLQIQRMDYMAG